MFGIAFTKKARRQKRYKKIREIARRQGRISFGLNDYYLDQLAFEVLDAIIEANTITAEQYALMDITVADHGPAVEAAEDAAAKAAALEEYAQARADLTEELEPPASDYHRSAPTSVPEPTPEPVRETPQPSSYDDSSSRSSGRSSGFGGFGGSSDDDSSRSSGGWGGGGGSSSSDYSSSSSSSDSGSSSSD